MQPELHWMPLSPKRLAGATSRVPPRQEIKVNYEEHYVPSEFPTSPLTCCLREVAALSSAALSTPSPWWAGAPFMSSTASTLSSCRPLRRSSSNMPARVAFNRSPIRTRSLPDHSEFTQPRRPAIVRAKSVWRQTRWSPVNGRAHCSPLAWATTVNTAWALCDMSNTGADA